MRVSKLEAKLETKDSTKTQQNTPQPNPSEAQQLNSVQQPTLNKSNNKNNFKKASQRKCCSTQNIESTKSSYSHSVRFNLE